MLYLSTSNRMELLFHFHALIGEQLRMGHIVGVLVETDEARSALARRGKLAKQKWKSAAFIAEGIESISSSFASWTMT